MKKTININLGGLVFQIDEDAYDKLNTYIEALKRKFTDVEERTEIIQDIEYRFAELFGADLNKTKEVVSLDMVKSAIATMGEPEEIEDELENNESSSSEKVFAPQYVERKLFRDPNDKVFAGVLSGLSKYFGINDAIWFRIATILLTIATVGFPMVIIYIILWIVMPEARTSSERLQMTGEPINLDNIEGQVKKNINTDEIKRTTVRVANKFGELGPMFIKIAAIFLILIFAFKIFGVSITMLFGIIVSMFNSEYIGLLFNSNSSFYFAALSSYLIIIIPIGLALYLSIKLLTKKKINWLMSFSIAFILFLLSIIGISLSAAGVVQNFKTEAEQTQFVALQNPTIEELDIEFPYEKIKDDLSMKMQFGVIDDDNDFNIEGIEVLPDSKQIKINAVELDIVPLRNDTIFKLTKTMYSRGKTFDDAEERIEKINHDFELINETVIAIPKMLMLEDETKWRIQLLRYELQVPIGKRIYFGDNAKKVVDNVDFNGDFSKRDLANNTWEMTKNGLKCLTCENEDI